MKIVVDARTMGSRPSGIGMYLYDFLKELIKDKEFEFILLSDVETSEYMNYFRKMGVDIRTQGKEVYKSAGVYPYFKFIQQELDKIQPDIFWEVNTVIPIKLRGKFKTMITVHDMFPITHVKYFGIIYSLYFRYSLHKTLAYTDMILYNSNQTKITTETAFPKAKNIINSIGYIISNPLTESLPLNNNGYFLYVGNMEKRKGVDLLLKGFREYKKRGGNKKLTIAGKMQEDDIRELLSDVMAEIEDVEYLDYVSHETKQQLYANCDCFVFPSKAEGFGMPILEVMKYNKPILVSNLNIYDELIGDCLNKFNINVNESEQINNLCEAMLTHHQEIDKNKYEAVLDRYMPEKLGCIVGDFIKRNGK